jgi:hypothetical protein
MISTSSDVDVNILDAFSNKKKEVNILDASNQTLDCPRAPHVLPS